MYKETYDLCLYLEQAVQGFSRYHKYGLGADLRDGAIRGGSAGSPLWVRVRRTGAVSVMKATMRTVSAIGWIAAVFVRRASVHSGS